MAIRPIKQEIAVDDVTKIIVTAPILNEETGDWERDIRVVTSPLNDEQYPTFTLRVAADQKSKIAVHAPEQEF